jgi:hypothetical protein
VANNRPSSDTHPDYNRPKVGPSPSLDLALNPAHAMSGAGKSSVTSTQKAWRLLTSPNLSDFMDLIPKLPPGRANRKALVFTAEIQRLRAAGYSFEAIRVALLDAGLKVSLTTVKREAARKRSPSPAVRREQAAPPASTATPAKPSPVPVGRIANSANPFDGDPRSSKEIAEAFMKGRNTNPLLQERNKHENRSN